MRHGDGESGDRDFRTGRRELARHRPDKAVRALRAAAESCPASKSGELSRRLYWLALALLRLDRPELAIKSLASAQKLRPRGMARAAYRARANDYGMPRRPSPELDDFYAFYSVHMCAYLGRKGKPRFESAGEKDAAVRIIGDAWLAVSRSGTLSGKAPAAKLELFRGWKIAFPSFGMEGADAMEGADCGRVVQVDFRRRTALAGGERCRCGSGLPFIQCCGRTSSPRELACE